MSKPVVTRFRSLAHRLPAYRRGAHGAVQLALRTPHRRQVPAAHRGHRPRALHGSRPSEPSSTGSDGSSSTGTASPPPVRRAPRATARCAEQLLAAGNAYRCYLTPAELDVMHEAIAAERELAKQEKRPPRGPQIIQSPWRDRDPKTAPAGVKPALRLKAPRDGETVIEDRVQGRVVVPEHPARRHDHPAQRRQPGLQLRRGGGRPRHGRHPRHPRRRSSDQRRAASADLQGHGLGCAGVRPRAADPRTRRRQALQAPRRARHRGLSRHGLPARGPAQLSGPARLEPRRRRDLLHRAGDGVVRHRRHQQGARAGSTSPSSPTSTATTSARPASTSSCGASRTSCPDARQAAPRSPPGSSAVGWDKLAAALPTLKERAKTLQDLVDGAAYLTAGRPLALDDKAAKLLDAEARGTLAKLLPRTRSDCRLDGPRAGGGGARPSSTRPA